MGEVNFVKRQRNIASTHARGIVIKRFILNKKRTLKKDKGTLENNKRRVKDKSKSPIDNASFINLFNERHRLFKGRNDQTAIRR